MSAIVDHCRREFEQVARSFWLIPEIIPLRQREDIALLYCFCRRLDDAVDEAPDAQHARAALEQFRAELDGRAERRPLVAAFLESAARNQLPLECLRSLLDGMESDLGPVRIAGDEALLLYCYRVSACVGLLLAPLLGVKGREAEERVVDLGIALQLTNIILGVDEDARRDRVYVPPARLGDLRGLADFADRYYASAAEGCSLVPLRYRHGVLLLARAYRDLGRRAARGEKPLKVPLQLPLLSKLRHLGELLLLALHPSVIGVLPPPPHDPSLHLFARRSDAPSHP